MRYGTLARRLVIEGTSLKSEQTHGGTAELVRKATTMNDEVISIADAAAECGMSVDELIRLMVNDGMLLEHPNGGYIAGPHPDLVGLR